MANSFFAARNVLSNLHRLYPCKWVNKNRLEKLMYPTIHMGLYATLHDARVSVDLTLKMVDK